MAQADSRPAHGAASYVSKQQISPLLREKQSPPLRAGIADVVARKKGGEANPRS
jgi:hypothetical protein